MTFQWTNQQQQRLNMSKSTFTSVSGSRTVTVKEETRSFGASAPNTTGWKTVKTETVYTTDGGRQVQQTITTGDASELHEHFQRRLLLPSEGASNQLGAKSREDIQDKPKKHGGLFSKVKGTITGKGSEPDGDFANNALKAHNIYRAKHGVPALKLSKELCKFAQEWADKLGREDSFKHRDDAKYGENIYMKWTSDPNYQLKGNEPVDDWYSEIKDHKFGQEPRTLASGHFTQVIWRASQEMGIGKARTKSNKHIVVANYSPAGNLIGSFTPNVPPPK